MNTQAMEARIKDLEGALRTTAEMLAYEATCHDESCDKKRRTYVKPLRDQVRFVQAVLDRTDYGRPPRA